MEKDFDSWNQSKKKIHAEPALRFCHPREVWWCSLGVNVGFEQDGTGSNFDRPVVVMRGFNERIFLGVPLTGQEKTGKYYFPVGIVGNRYASAVLSQIRLIDAKRLVRKFAVLDEVVFKDLKNALVRTLFE
jgi:mRNA interferase MazF